MGCDEMSKLFREAPFSDESFVELLHVLKNQGHEFVKMTEAAPPLPLRKETSLLEKQIVLRHDVDLSPEGALKLARMEQNEKVQSHFFFQLNCGAYQLLSPECLDICRNIQSMDHVVGLHVDSAVFPEEEEKISGTLEWIRENLFPIDPIISFHRPAATTLGVTYRRFISVYGHEWFDPDYYASDSRGEDQFYAKLETLCEQNVPFIQLLLHPCWWESETDRKEILLRLRKRQLQSLDQYLLNNFPKVFGSVIESTP